MINNSQILFQGSARLGLMLGVCQLPWALLSDYISVFLPELTHYQEISLDATGTSLGLMTRGSGKDFAFRVTHYLETHGIAEVDLKRFLRRSQDFEYANLFFKVELDQTGPVEFSYYIRRRPALEIAQTWLAAVGIDDDDWQRLTHYAQCLQKHTVHFLGEALTLQGSSVQKIYFSQPEEPTAWERIQQAAQLAGTPLSQWQYLQSYAETLKYQPLFFSIAFANGHQRPGCKLDVRGVSPKLIDALLKHEQHSQAAIDRGHTLLQLHNKSLFDYVGFHLEPEKAIAPKVYMFAEYPQN